MAKRTEFTESDDENLINYIARFKPDNSGRMGNNLYIFLEESADQRPWAKRHTWQSWRERYKKNQEWFNYKIKKYQKRHNTAQAQAKSKKSERNSAVVKGKAKAATDKAKSKSKVDKLVQAQAEEPEKEKYDGNASVEPLAAAASSSTAKPDLPAAERDAPTPKVESIEPKVIVKSPPTEVRPPATPTSKPSPAPVSHTHEPGDEIDSEEESASETDDQEEQADQEELYKELFGVSQFSDDNDDESLDAHSFDSTVNIKASPIRPHTPESTPSPLTPARSPIGKGRPPTLIEGPFRSSLKRTRTTSNSINNEPWPPKRMKKSVEDMDVTSPDVEMGHPRSQVGTKDAAAAYRQARVRPPAQINAVASSSKSLLPDPPRRHSKPTNLLKVICAKGSNDGFKSTTMPTKPLHRLLTTPNTSPSVALQATRTSPMDTDDPFVTNKPVNKGKTCASGSPIFLPNKLPPRIDLRQSLNSAPRRSSTLSSHTSVSLASTSTPHHSVTSFLLPEDQEIVNQVGFPEVMAVIAKHYGFDVDVAMNAFFVTKSITKTKEVLQHAKDVANSATSVLLAELANQTKGDGGDSDGDEEPQNIWRGRGSSSGRDQSTSSGRQKAKRKAKRPSLNIKPQPLDHGIDQNTPSDYSPPHTSRAGQFMRLVKQGRAKEAIDREQRRASGTFVAQTQLQSLNINSSNDVDPQPPVPTPQKETIQPHPSPDNISLPIVDPHRIFFKRISEGQSSLNEDEDDPAVVRLAQEHRQLVMDVTEENADGLRRFEQKNNQDLLRLWSLDWARQKIADM